MTDSAERPDPLIPAAPPKDDRLDGRFILTCSTALANGVAQPMGSVNGLAQHMGVDQSTSPPEPVVLLAASQPTHLDWLESILRQVGLLSLPRPVARFRQGETEWLVLESPAGYAIDRAWVEPNLPVAERFEWLLQIAKTLEHLHGSGVYVSSLRPSQVTITPTGQAVLIDPTIFVPLEGLAVQAVGPHTPPEACTEPVTVDARSSHFVFGSLLFELYCGRSPTLEDPASIGVPSAFVTLYPDAHPALSRLIGKTFCRDPLGRFPGKLAPGQDSSGFAELQQCLRQCRDALDRVTLDVAGWTSTGMYRAGNEDAFVVLHRAEMREESRAESALILVADGMGGEEGGEIASAMAVRTMKARLWPPEFTDTHETTPTPQRLLKAMKEANQVIWQTARDGKGPKGMGCTAEAVLVTDRAVFVAHAGDSRTYLAQGGRLRLVTRDQTLVEQLLYLKLITEAEAENHPRRSVLLQAVGGQEELEPVLYQERLKSGDWVMVCTDGLSNALSLELMESTLQNARSAEQAARRLINLANAAGAADNITVALVRVS